MLQDELDWALAGVAINPDIVKVATTGNEKPALTDFLMNFLREVETDSRISLGSFFAIGIARLYDFIEVRL